MKEIKIVDHYWRGTRNGLLDSSRFRKTGKFIRALKPAVARPQRYTRAISVCITPRLTLSCRASPPDKPTSWLAPPMRAYV